MKLVLCQECVGWVELRDGRCGECHEVIDVDAPDPSLSRLRAVIGALAARLGEVRVRRKRLPARGTLYATTEGLLFLPHQVDYVTHLIETTSTGTSMLWSLAAVVWHPLLFLSPLVKSRRTKEKLVEVSRPRDLAPEQGAQLPELLMESPGAFFIPLRSIRLIQCKRKTWSIDRGLPSTVKLVSDSEPDELAASIGRLASTDPWDRIVVDI